jgi:hypothetical protein
MFKGFLTNILPVCPHMSKTTFIIILACLVMAMIAAGYAFGRWGSLTVWVVIVLFLIYWSKQ